MLMTIRYQNGPRVEAVLLAADKDRMRVAVDSQRDTVELHRVDDCWYTERGVATAIETLIPLPGTEFSHFCNLVYPRAIAAGRTPVEA